MSRKPEYFDLKNPAHFEILAEEFLPRSGGVITGAMQMQSAIIKSADSGARWEGDVRGLRGYDTTGALVFNLDTTTGSLTLTGAVSAGGTITGSTLQTAASGKRVVIAGSPGDRIDFYSGSADETSNGYILVAVSGAAGATAGVATWVTPAINSQDRASISMTSESKDGSTSKTVVALSADTVLGVATTGSADTSLQWQGDIALFASVTDPPASAASYVRLFNSGGTGLRAISTSDTAPLWPIRIFSDNGSDSGVAAAFPVYETMSTDCFVTFTTRVASAVVDLSGFVEVVNGGAGWGGLVAQISDGTTIISEISVASENAADVTIPVAVQATVASAGTTKTYRIRVSKIIAGGTVSIANAYLKAIVIG
jgi:hypothetical protein